MNCSLAKSSEMCYQKITLHKLSRYGAGRVDYANRLEVVVSGTVGVVKALKKMQMSSS